MNAITCIDTAEVRTLVAVLRAGQVSGRKFRAVNTEIHRRFHQTDAAQYMCEPLGQGFWKFSIPTNPFLSQETQRRQLLAFRDILSRIGDCAIDVSTIH